MLLPSHNTSGLRGVQQPPKPFNAGGPFTNEATPGQRPAHMPPAERPFHSAPLQPPYSDSMPSAPVAKAEGGWGRGDSMSRYSHANGMPSRGPGSYVRPPQAAHLGASGGQAWLPGVGGRGSVPETGWEYARGASLPGWSPETGTSPGLRLSLGAGLGGGRVTDPLSRDLYPPVGMC